MQRRLPSRDAIESHGRLTPPLALGYRRGAQCELRRHFGDVATAERPRSRPQELCLSIVRAWNVLLSRTGREPTVAERGKHLELSGQETAERVLAIDRRSLPSLDVPGHVDDADGYADAGYAQVETQDAFDRLLAGIDGRVRTMLRLRFEESCGSETACGSAARRCAYRGSSVARSSGSRAPRSAAWPCGRLTCCSS